MKLKNNYSYIYHIFKQSLNTQKFLLVFIFSIILSAYGVIQIAWETDYVTGFLRILTNPYYIAIIILILMMNLSNIFTIFENNQFYIIRFNSKKKYLIELIKNICFSNLCIIILNLALVTIGLNIFNPNEIGESFKGYEISNNIYLLFTIIKFIMIMILITIISVLFLKLFNNKVMAIFNVLLSISMIIVSSYHYMVTSIIQLPIFIGTYLRYQLYSSFIFEVSCFLLYSSLLYIIIIVLNKITLKYMKE